MTTTRCLMALGLALAVLWGSGGGELQDERDTYMQFKLAHAQQLLGGLVREDYTAISRHAQQLKLLSQDASWEAYRGAEYEELSVMFRRETDRLTDAAAHRNLDGATLAYVQLTLTCVQCHEQMRTDDAKSIAAPR